MFGSVAQAAPVLGLQKLDRNLAVLNDNKRARKLVERRNRLKTDEDINDLKYLLDYGMVDAEISYKAAMLQQELLPISVGANSPATPARLMIKNARLPQAPQRVMNETWEAYFGGLSLMIDRGVHHSKKPCYIFDFLSMYPSTIKNLKLLNLDYIDAKGFDWDVPKNVSDVLDFEYHFCVHAKVKGIVLSKEMCWHDGIPKLVPVQGEYEGWFWDCELAFLEVLDWDDIRYFVYMKEYPIQEEIERMLLKRAQMKSTDPQRLGYKILLNSMYGVICVKGDTEIIVRHKETQRVNRMRIDTFVNSFDYTQYMALSANPDTLKLEWKNILQTYKKDNSLNEIKYDNGVSLFVSPDHEVSVCNNRDIRHRDTIRIIKKKQFDVIIDKKPRDYGFAPCGWDTKADDVKFFDITHIPSRNKSFPVVSMDLMMEFLGMFAADGYIRKPNNASTSFIGFGFKKKRKRERCKQILDLLGIYYTSCMGSCSGPNSGLQQKFCIPYDNLSEYLTVRMGQKCKDKHLPFDLESLNNRQLQLFFDSYLFFEGTKHGNGIRSCTISETLRKQLIYIGQRLGYFTSSQIKQRDETQEDICILNFRPNTVRGAKVGDLHLVQYNSVIAQPKRGNYPTYDLEIEDNHTFIANFIVTQNCQYNPKAGAAFSAHKGSLLTAMCRSTLLDTIIRNYPNAIMADTDSLGTIGKPKYDPKLMQLQFDKSIDFKDWSKEKHYYFQKEFEFYHYIAVRLKRYMMIRDWNDDWTFSDYVNENKRIKNENIANDDKPSYRPEQKMIKYALHATTISMPFMDKVFDYMVGKEVDVPERYMMAYRQTFKRWLSEGKLEMIGGFTKTKELVGKLDFGIYMDNFIRPDNKLYRKDEHWLKCEKGRFHTEGTLKPYANCKPYVQHLREFKDDHDKQKRILDLFNKYQVNTDGWSS
jgi:hypothetical protein